MNAPDCSALVRRRLADAGLASHANAGLVEELAQHLDDRYRAALAQGSDEATAQAAALEELAGCERLAVEIEARRRLSPAPVIPGGPMASPFSALRQDIVYAFRTLCRAPGFTTVAILTVALSTGPTMVALGVANWLFVRPVPGVQQPDRLGIVWYGHWNDGHASFSPFSISYARLAEMRPLMPSIADMAGQSAATVNVSIDGNVPRVLPGQTVSANFFEVLGVRFSEGRGFLPEEDRAPRAEPVVVLSAALARSLFPSSAAVNRAIHINGQLFTVVGVARSEFEGSVIGRRASLWLPGLTVPLLRHQPADWVYPPGRGPFSEFVIRLAPGATFERAELELGAASKMLADRGTPYTSMGPSLFPGAGLSPFARETMAPF